MPPCQHCPYAPRHSAGDRVWYLDELGKQAATVREARQSGAYWITLDTYQWPIPCQEGDLAPMLEVVVDNSGEAR